MRTSPSQVQVKAAKMSHAALRVGVIVRTRAGFFAMMAPGAC